jgi:hypothetical protein
MSDIFRWIDAAFDWADENAHKVAIVRSTDVFGHPHWAAKIAYFDGQATRHIACRFPWHGSPHSPNPDTTDADYQVMVYSLLDEALEELQKRPKPHATQAQMDQWAKDIIKSNKKTRN